jgi:outer membrane protein assembly factor BamB
MSRHARKLDAAPAELDTSRIKPDRSRELDAPRRPSFMNGQPLSISAFRSMPRQGRHAGWSSGALLVAAFGLVLGAGCQGGGHASTSTAPGAAGRGEEAASALEAHYVIPPSAAHAIQYRIDWQTTTEPHRGSGVSLFTVQDDSVFVLDGRNFLTRLRERDGERVWRLAVADAVTRIQGITYLNDSGRVLLTAGGDLFVLDAATGAQIDRQRLERTAGTSPVLAGPALVYGALNGQLVWHSYDVGEQWQAYQIATTIQLPPVLYDRTIITIGGDGRVTAIDAGTASMLWAAPLLDRVVAAPAAGLGLVFVAGLDQHLWAFDAQTGRLRWKHLSESALTDSPVLVGSQVYQQIPGLGIMAFEAAVRNMPRGKMRWTASGVAGNVVGESRGVLLVWDAASNNLTLLSAARGHVIGVHPLPKVRHLSMQPPLGGVVFAASDAGEVIRLQPRN